MALFRRQKLIFGQLLGERNIISRTRVALRDAGVEVHAEKGHDDALDGAVWGGAHSWISSCYGLELSCQKVEY